MTLKRWLAYFLSSLAVTAFIFVAVNVLVDPFGVFGDRILDYYAYDMTENPRVSKIAYLDRNYKNYDSYIIGCSKTSSFPNELLNRYSGASFYNMLMYGGDMYDVEKTAEYVLENYNAENIIINMGLEELVFYDVEIDPVKGNMHTKAGGGNPLKFYGKYLFANPRYAADKLSSFANRDYLPSEDRVFLPETGVYDKRLRDVEPIGDINSYLDKYPDFITLYDRYDTMPKLNECLGSIERIVRLCRERDVELTVVISPLYKAELDMYYNADVQTFLKKLSVITDFWDFSGYTSVSYEPRYFYDFAHFRNCVGDMMLSRMFDNDNIYIPDDFGFYVTAENADERIAGYTGGDIKDEPEVSADVPVLLYHHISETETNDVTMSPMGFEAQIRALYDAGYNAVTVDEMIRYVYEGVSLPEKPVLITFDDGYESNMEYAAPILRKYGMKAEIFAIGVLVGTDTYKDTGEPIHPHFSWEEANAESDVFTIQSHGYDMHKSEKLDAADFRSGVLQNPGENEEDYIKAFTDDFKMSASEIDKNTGRAPQAFAYPFGYYTDMSEVLLNQLGVKATFGITQGVNTIIKGLPQSLLALKRIAPYEDMQPWQLVGMLEKN